MADSYEHIESAIDEAKKTRDRVRRSKVAQVASNEELTMLKSVAYAWFKSHRPFIPNVDLAAVDSVYQSILGSTDKKAARSTYIRLLKEAQEMLVAVREVVTESTSSFQAIQQSGSFKLDSPPSFASLTADTSMQMILIRRWSEVQNCISADANLAATVMMGGLLESLILARLIKVQNKDKIYTANKVPKDKNSGRSLPLSEWKLLHMVEVSHELGWITKSAKDVGNVLRDFRNYIHPHKELTDNVHISTEDVNMFWELCKSISRQILTSAEKSL
ncbi:MAG: hypothetical protein OEV87_13310 [Phycisphaerae bacterium]|nr:hypothetical protein [Phycisphaerae bacterium]